MVSARAAGAFGPAWCGVVLGAVWQASNGVAPRRLAAFSAGNALRADAARSVRRRDLAEFSTIRELQLVTMSNKQAQCGASRATELTVATGVKR
jgi:hypothetical protein